LRPRLAFPIEERDARRTGARQVGGDGRGRAPVDEPALVAVAATGSADIALRVRDVGVVGVGRAGGDCVM